MLEVLKKELAEKGSVTLNVKIRASSKLSMVKSILDNSIIKIDIAAPAEAGKANKELLRFLAEEFSVRRSQVEILSGHTSPQKVMRITSIQISDRTS